MTQPARQWLLLMLGMTVLTLARADTPPQPRQAYARFAQGDDPQWARLDFDDNGWQRVAIGSGVKRVNFPPHLYGAIDFIPTRAGIFWIRYRIEVPGADPGQTDLDPGEDPPYPLPREVGGIPIDGLHLASPSSYEIFWDGERIAQKGVVGRDRDSEIPGPLDHHVRIPERLLTPGVHVLAFRLSNWHYNFPASMMSFGAQFTNVAERMAFEVRRSIMPIVAFSLALLFAIICTAMFFAAERRRAFLLCAVLSFCIALFYFLIALRWLHEPAYPWFYPRLLAATIVMTVIAVLMPWVMLEQFAVPRKGAWLAALAPLLVISWQMSDIYEFIALWLCVSMLLLSIAIAVWALWRKKPGALSMLVALVICLFTVDASRRTFLNFGYLFTFFGLVLFMLWHFGVQIRDARRLAQQAQLTAARLETELLRKNLHPHFLMNTLTALMEVIEQSPSTAVKLIDDLAREFRLLTAMSAEKIVPLEQELELCRAHLHVVGIRAASEYRLEVDQADPSAPVPPALFLTLIENGFSHQQIAGRNAIFRLSCEEAEGGRRYRFLSPGPLEYHPKRPHGGTGLRYVRSRLEESFPGRWSLSHGPTEEGWATLIAIFPPGRFAS